MKLLISFVIVLTSSYSINVFASGSGVGPRPGMAFLSSPGEDVYASRTLIKVVGGTDEQLTLLYKSAFSDEIAELQLSSTDLANSSESYLDSIRESMLSDSWVAIK